MVVAAFEPEATKREFQISSVACSGIGQPRAVSEEQPRPLGRVVSPRVGWLGKPQVGKFAMVKRWVGRTHGSDGFPGPPRQDSLGLNARSRSQHIGGCSTR